MDKQQLNKHKKTAISIVLSFAALVFVFSFFPSVENQNPVVPGTNPGDSSNGPGFFYLPGSGASDSRMVSPFELAPDERLSEPAYQTDAGGYSESLYSGTRADLPVVQGRNPSPLPLSIPAPISNFQQELPTMLQSGAQSLQESGGGDFKAGISGLLSKFSSRSSGSTGMMPGQNMFGGGANAPPPARGSFSAPSQAPVAPNREVNHAMGTVRNQLGIAQSRASQAQNNLNRVRSLSDPGARQAAAAEARYFAEQARAAASRAVSMAQSDPSLQSLVAAVRAEADKATSAAQAATAEASRR